MDFPACAELIFLGAQEGNSDNDDEDNKYARSNSTGDAFSGFLKTRSEEADCKSQVKYVCLHPKSL